MKNSVNWNFDNSYSKLPDTFKENINPFSVKNPELIVLNKNLATELNLNFSNIEKDELSSLFAGNNLPKGSHSIAQAYAGHQFGHFTMLGDGRATLIGEHVTNKNDRYDIQLKGSGKTSFSRTGDGRAVLGPMLREYIISEGMHNLNIPTTRGLAVVKTGEEVIRESPLPGAILTRVASSHIRVGTFQYVAARNKKGELEILLNYVVKRHYPELMNSKNKALDLLNVLIDKQIDLVVNWMRVGFIHGVMNTDNCLISGETIDYGPCAFMDSFDPATVFSSIDRNGRYSYSNQPYIAQWNLARLAESLIPLIHEEREEALPRGLLYASGSLAAHRRGQGWARAAGDGGGESTGDRAAYQQALRRDCGGRQHSYGVGLAAGAARLCQQAPPRAMVLLSQWSSCGSMPGKICRLRS